MPYQVECLPFANETELETRAVLKKTASAHRYLAELKGVAATIPNEIILINMLTLQEAKDSSAVENIITTHDELFKAELFSNHPLNPSAKEVQDYATALKLGFEKVKRKRLIRLNDIVEIQSLLEKNKAGLRKLPGTELKNQQTGEVVYVPPQDADEISRLMDNLVTYINDDSLSDLDALVKMAIIHHQFESIHPFYDGNGRAGRIINILYLVMNGLLDLPVLYLSRYMIRDKAAYYRNLQEVRDTNQWEQWLLYMLEGIEQTSIKTISLIQEIKDLMMAYKHQIREQFPKIYSQDLINNLFKHPYTKIDFMMNDLGVSRITATKYLNQLTESGFLQKEKISRSNYYINKPLCKLFIENST
ncbi:Fic family protein MloA [hydrothermal vent metagenome]|uniref:Fic family protein MloA n=1 Tax=hydrothermal vent metagenome TaxID=652676 RepID=A0A3B0XFI5_9ZZZZ